MRSQTLPRCSTWLTSPGSSSFMPSGQSRKLLLSPESSCFHGLLQNESKREKEKEKESACTCRPQIPPVTSSSTSPLQNFCCSSLLTTASHIRAPLTTAAVFSPGLQLLFYHICLTGCSVVDHCGQNQLAGVSPSAHETMTLSTLWAWDSGFRIAVLVNWALRVALYPQSVLFLFSPRFLESRGILLEAWGI